MNNKPLTAVVLKPLTAIVMVAFFATSIYEGKEATLVQVHTEVPTPVGRTVIMSAETTSTLSGGQGSVSSLTIPTFRK